MSAIPEWILTDLPLRNARTVLSGRQKAILVVLLGVLALLLLWSPRDVLLVLNLAAIVLYLIFSHYKLVLQFLSPRPGTPANPPPDMPYPVVWPSYTLLVPLYHEESAVPGLVAHLRTLDYPVDRLQILLLVEEDDAGTRRAVEALVLEPPFEVVLVPVSQPRTKPKACNYGLRLARGEFLVVYDAEDRPEPGQLREAALRFARAPAYCICLQAPLNFYNRDRNPLTRLFTAEYSCWFDYCLPGLVRLDAPIPLGGTSNHFRRRVLGDLKGWDPFNVTEDCDLGIRLYIGGHRTGILDSTTWEEATFRLLPWIRQRSRWVKGYFQTYLVHLRQHGALVRHGGLGGALHFHLLFGATAFCLLMNPFYWALTATWFLTRSPAVSGFFPLWIMLPALMSFLGANAAFVLSGMLGCLQRRYYHLVPWCLLLPFYWILMSIAAWKGVLQLVRRPFYWEKTPHEGRFVLEVPP